MSATDIYFCSDCGAFLGGLSPEGSLCWHCRKHAPKAPWTATLAIEDEDGRVCECSLASFLENNQSGVSDVDLADVAHMAVGQVLKFGGGAAAFFRVTRVA